MIESCIGTAEIMDALKVKPTKANEIMWMFKKRGQAYKVGKLWRVKEKDFKSWFENECRLHK